MEKRSWTGHLSCDTNRNLSNYITDLGGLYNLPLKKVVKERKCIEDCETQEEIERWERSALWQPRGRLLAMQSLTEPVALHRPEDGLSYPPHGLLHISCSKHVALGDFAGRAGILRKPPKKVVDLADDNRSDKCRGG